MQRAKRREEHDRRCIEGAGGGCDGGLEVLCQAAIAVEPDEAAFHHPAPWMDGDLTPTIDAGWLGQLRERSGIYPRASSDG